MPDAGMTWLYAIIAGLFTAFFYACAAWTTLQCRKEGTLIPRGLLPERYGELISLVLYAICGISLVLSGFFLGWWVVITAFVTWLVGRRLAIYAERFFYARDRLKAFEHHAKRMLEKYGEEDAIRAWNMAVPRWWINLMSWSWECEYRKRVGSILKSTDPSDPLFDQNRFISEHRGNGA